MTTTRPQTTNPPRTNALKQGWARHSALLLAAILVLTAAPGSVAAHEDEVEPLPADTGDGLSPAYEAPAGADRIIGSPEAGPEPQHSGDRGGSLQFATMAAVAAAVAFIMWRVARAARRSSHHSLSET